MLEIYPNLAHANYKCPACGCQLSEASSLFFQGQHVLADITCTCCEKEYYQTYPIAHGAILPVSFTKDGTKTRYPEKSELWMAKPLISSMLSDSLFEPEIEVIKHKDYRKAILLNCLDSCWGHVFQKLLNAQYHLEHDNEFGLILLIPYNFKWMVPDGVAEVWSIRASMNDFNKRISYLDAFVKSQYTRFESIFLSEAYIQPDSSTIDIAKFTSTERFNLDQFYRLPATVTLIWRDDRFWYGNRLEELLFLGSLKFRLFPALKWFFVWRQMARYKQVAHYLNKKKPDLKIYLCGFGTEGHTGKQIIDRRANIHSDELEKKWCEVYAKSHVAVGVHGSNMLLPSSLAAGFVNIVPYWKMDRLGEDIAHPRSGSNPFYLGRFIVGFTTPKTVAKHVISILDGFYNL